jgi:hypothetical protein
MMLFGSRDLLLRKARPAHQILLATRMEVRDQTEHSDSEKDFFHGWPSMDKYAAYLVPSRG